MNNLSLNELLQLAASNEYFTNVIKKESNNRIKELFYGMLAYLQSDLTRPHPKAQKVWEEGGSSLLYYHSPNNLLSHNNQSKAILLIPSLINRYYILDFNKNRSLAQHLVKKGFSIYLMDWGTPSENEKSYNCSDYITSPLKNAVSFIREEGGHDSLTTIGHCMGGVISLAHAITYPKQIDATCLIATPWDFNTCRYPFPKLSDSSLERVESYISEHQFIPGEHILNLFYLKDPWNHLEKIRQFSSLINKDKDKLQNMMQLENWVNDYVSVTQGVARDSFINWGHKNQTINGEWRVNNKIINPRNLEQPCLIAMGDKDNIVPLESTMPLVEQIPDNKALIKNTGHIGLIAGGNAEENLYNPIVNWLENIL